MPQIPTCCTQTMASHAEAWAILFLQVGDAAQKLFAQVALARPL